MKYQKGNALFFILIAIGLLGLLTVMMSRSSNTTNETGSYEQNVIAANEILSYAKNIENAVQGLLARGCSENDISFWNDSDGNGTEDASDTYFNTESDLTNRACHVFWPEGAGLTFETPKEQWLDTSNVGKTYYNEYVFNTNCVNGVGSNPDVSGCNTPATAALQAELILALPYVNRDLCAAINQLSFGDSDIPLDIFNYIIAPSIFRGSFRQDSSGVNYATPSERRTGCLTGDSTGLTVGPGEYGIYHVLIAR